MDRPRVAISEPASPFDELRATFVAALNRGDPHAAVEVYADDARVLVPSSDPMDGRAAIEAFWRAGLESGMSGIKLVPSQLTSDPTFACEIGNYVLSAEPMDEGTVVEEGRYLIVHRQRPDGAWRRALELFAPSGRASLTGGSTP